MDRMSIREVIGSFFSNASKSVQLQAEIREGVANQAELMNQRLRELIELQAHQAARNEQLLNEVLAGISNQTDVLNQRLQELVDLQAPGRRLNLRGATITE
jgi:hypothetical protein